MIHVPMISYKYRRLSIKELMEAKNRVRANARLVMFTRKLCTF